MRRLSIVLLVATVGVLAILGLAPASFDVTNGVPAMPCRAVIAPISNASVFGEDEVPRELIEEWLIAVGYSDDDDRVAADVLAAATDRAHGLCADARTGRLGTMLLVGVAGLGACVLTAAPRGRAGEGS